MLKNMLNRKKIAIIVSSPLTAKVFLKHQIFELSKIYDLTLIANFGIDFDPLKKIEWINNSISIKHIPINRKIKLFSDLQALLMLYFFLRSHDFSLVHSYSPKAGLLAMIASFIARVPIRIHTFIGQVWATKQGMLRFFLKILDKLTSILATSVLVDSYSQREYLISNINLLRSKSKVLGYGSISGVDENIFKANSEARNSIREKLNVVNSSLVILFLGRLKKEKGVFELVNAFVDLKHKDKKIVLWFVGDDEEDLQNDFYFQDNICWIPFTDTPERYMAAADIFCLPSYREGFGSSVIEAAACGIPSVGSNIYGLNDAIIDDITGILVPVKSVKSLQLALQKLINDKKLREQMGFMAKKRAIEKFSQSRSTNLLLKHYSSML
jgi:glycosyltransferase involved in cell wall biosynthesis